MKRKLALLLLVLLVATVALAACNQPEATTVDFRWSTETHVFRVTLADFVGGSSNSLIFNSYDSSGNILTSNTSSSYRKDKAIAGESFAAKDEIMPVDVDGTYTLEIKPGSDTMSKCVVTGKQVLYLQYMLQSTVQGETVDLSQWEELNELKVDDDEVRANTNLEIKDDRVVLKSTTATMVEIVNETQPVSSRTTVDGFYLGKANRQVSKYDVATTYNYEGKKPTATVTVNDNEPVVHELISSSSVKLIDANQVLLYVRSLSKTEGSLQDSHTAYVFDPLTGKTQAASFGYTYKDNVILTDLIRGEQLYTTVNSVSVTIGGNAFMMQDNVPQTVKADQISVSTVTRARLTTLRFRVGFLSYEIEYSNAANAETGWNDIWQALTPVVEEPKEE